MLYRLSYTHHAAFAAAPRFICVTAARPVESTTSNAGNSCPPPLPVLPRRGRLHFSPRPPNLYGDKVAIDINSDLGEIDGPAGAELDASLLTVISSANVACGGHAGTASSMDRVCSLAAENRVAVGAQVSYVDREGFGRRRVDVPTDVLTQQLVEQALALEEFARRNGTAVTYVKAHGQLYHDSNTDTARADAVLAAVELLTAELDRPLTLLALSQSLSIALAGERGMPAVGEAFADRAYGPDGHLLPRDREGALITDPAESVSRLQRLLRDRQIVAIDGTPVDVTAGSICVHSDTPGAALIARRVSAAIEADRVRISPFAPPPARSHTAAVAEPRTP